MNSGNSKIFGSNFGLFWPKFCPPIFFSWFLPLLDVITLLQAIIVCN